MGYNYRLTDLQCALGLSQLNKVDCWIHRRQELAKRYDEAFKPLVGFLTPLTNIFGSSYHIYVVKFHLRQYYDQFNHDSEALKQAKQLWNRDVIFNLLKQANIGVNVHYKPIYLLSFYQNHPQVNTPLGLCPVAEKVYNQIITLPLFPTMTNQQQDRVIETVHQIINQISSSIPSASELP